MKLFSVFFRKALIVLTFMAFIGHQGARGQTVEVKGFFEELEPAWEQSGIKGMVFGFVTASGQRYTQPFGRAVWSGEGEVTPDHIFRMASMTKAITSVAALQLVEQGLIALDDTVARFLPEIGKIPILRSNGQLLEARRPITLRHLLTHTSGFGYSFMNDRLAGFEQPESWPHRDLPRLTEAGNVWIYGTSTDWVGRLVEEISGLSLEDYFRKNITGPLQMHRTWFDVPDSLKNFIVSVGTRVAPGQPDFRESPQRIPALPVREYSGGGGLFSTTNDYLNFFQCILNGGEWNGVRILNEETVMMMFEDQLPALLGPVRNPVDPSAGERRGQSLAWGIQTVDNDFGRKAGSGYWSGILNTYYSIDINTGIAVVVMANYLPFLDPGVLDLYKKFEEMVRTN
ncbi:MAG: beta-lactamase family protein [Bacteroidales bacterium]|nr:beta-lactamase family protein [Bacteroidales bacterium]